MIGSSRRRCLWTLSVLAVVACSSTATAEGRSDVLAQVLFEEGVALMEEGHFDEACPKLAESQRLDPAGGTLLNLASCLERLGQLASAYTTYNDALSAAIRDGRKERESTAREKITALRPLLSHIVLRVPPGANLTEIRLDGTAVGRSGWGTALPVDQGKHTIAASAASCEPWSIEVTIGAEPTNTPIDLPMRLVSVSPASPVAVPAIAPAPVAPRREASSRRTGMWLALSGGAMVGAGLVVGALAYAKKSESDDACPTRTTCTDDGVGAMRTATTLAWTSNVVLGVGLATAAVGGALFFFTAPGKNVAVRIGPASGAITGSF